MHLRSPGGIDHAIETLRGLQAECDSCGSSFHDFEPSRNQYIKWVDNAYQQLRSLFADDRLAEGLLGRSFFELQRIDADTSRSGPAAWTMLTREVRVQLERLQAAEDHLRKLKVFAERPGEIVLPDTSALVRGVWFEHFDWATELALPSPVRLVVPILVVEELDNLKDRERATKAADRARRVLKRLRELCGAVFPGHPAPIPDRAGTTIEVLVDDDWHERRPNNDGEIVHQVQYIGALTGKDVTLVCVDAAMEFRARSRGVRAWSMPLSDERAAKGDEPPSGTGPDRQAL